KPPFAGSSSVNLLRYFREVGSIEQQELGHKGKGSARQRSDMRKHSYCVSECSWREVEHTEIDFPLVCALFRERVKILKQALWKCLLLLLYCIPCVNLHKCCLCRESRG